MVHFSLQRREEPLQLGRPPRTDLSPGGEAAQHRVVEALLLEPLQRRRVHLIVHHHRTAVVQVIHLETEGERGRERGREGERGGEGEGEM